MQHELKRIQQEVGITFVYVTHDQEEALTMSDRIAVDDPGPRRSDRIADRHLPPPRHALRRRVHRRCQPAAGQGRRSRPVARSRWTTTARGSSRPPAVDPSPRVTRSRRWSGPSGCASRSTNRLGREADGCRPPSPTSSSKVRLSACSCAPRTSSSSRTSAPTSSSRSCAPATRCGSSWPTDAGYLVAEPVDISHAGAVEITEDETISA